MAGRTVFPAAMILRVLIFLAVTVGLLGQAVPPAIFSGTIHGISKKHLVLETAEGNLIDFDLDGKTHILRGKKKIGSEDLQTGDAVNIEAEQEPARNKLLLKALRITASDQPKG